MDTDLIKDPEDGIVRFGPEVVETIRKECNLYKKEDREKAITIIEDWIEQQEHFVKKDFSKEYIERCIITCKGSLERTKKQLDKMCTSRSLIPHLFQVTNLKESEIMNVIDKFHFAILPKLTKDYYRVAVLRLKPDIVIKSTDEIRLVFKFVAILAEYLKSNDYCKGYLLIDDFFDVNFSDLVTKIDLVELQQCLSVLTEGYGCRIKGLYLVTSSKLLEGFIKILKPMFSEKIGGRIHAITSRKMLQDLIQPDVLPEDYGGIEKPVELLHDKLIEALCGPPVQKLLKEMNQATTDETKRRRDQFNDKYMGMPGTFRTLSLD